MVIDPSSPINVNTQSSKSRAHSSVAGSASTQTVDPSASSKGNVSLSSTGKSLVQLEKNIQSAPDIDSEKINTLKSEIASGNYTLNARAIAEKITQ